MPELPEVETIKRELKRALREQRLINVKIFDNKFFYKNGIKDIKTLVNTKLLSVERKGKFLILLFEKEFLLFHLGLTGFFIIQKNSFAKEKKHLISIFEFEKDSLFYFDIRKFSKIKKAKISKILHIKELKELGKDALEIELNEFKNIFKNKARKVKDLLMDQKVISGLGNIYVNELLFRAKINPFKLSCDLREEEVERMFFQMKKLLKEAIDLKGSSIRDYVDPKGEKGRFQEKFLVYGKKNQPCPECGQPLKYQRLSQRGTFYCQKCQLI
jgi:formamidopyrimidine-DNA glycosylase